MDKAKSCSESVNKLIWDCGSSLYDSYELKSLMRQLDSAMANSRCFSMPHLSSKSPPPPPPPPPQRTPEKQQSSIAKSIKKLIRLVFRSKPPCVVAQQQAERESSAGGSSGADSGILATIPEVWETELNSPEPCRRTVSERFTNSTADGEVMKDVRRGWVLELLCH